MVKEALVVKRDVLFKDKHFEGFLPITEFDYIPIILDNYFYHERTDEMEHDNKIKQIIPYIVIVNPKTKKIFTYRRAPDERYTEVRLRNKWAIAVGGHIERIDDKNPIEEGMMRELMEEVKMKDYPKPEMLGFLNYELGVEEFHLGVLALLKTEQQIEIGDEEIAECNFLSIKEIESLIENPETQMDYWSKLAFKEIKEYLLSK
jgi:predicted NUDIX family phosphoesterase